MYGIINIAISDLVKENFGEDNWIAIKKRIGTEADYFLSNEPYHDSITYNLATAVAEEMQMPLVKVLELFGEWWILRTAKEKYGGLMELGGSNLKEFLLNLPMFHNRVMLIYPKLTPPEFKITDVTHNSVQLHYYSKRLGLREFVRGLLQGLGKMYNTPVFIEILEKNTDNPNHEIFKVSW